jgi:hypothetical protein
MAQADRQAGRQAGRRNKGVERSEKRVSVLWIQCVCSATSVCMCVCVYMCGERRENEREMIPSNASWIKKCTVDDELNMSQGEDEEVASRAEH